MKQQRRMFSNEDICLELSLSPSLGGEECNRTTGDLLVTRDMRLWLSKVLECSS